MVKECITTGRTVEDAINSGCAQLGYERDQIQFEIVDLPRRGFLGLMNQPAKVRVYLEESKAQAAADYLLSILQAMGLEEATIETQEKEGSAVLTLSGEGLGVIIGRRGETLDALQYLAGLVANRLEGDYTRITIDSGNYREKREKTLESLARKLAGTAVKTGRSSTLEPMNPYERRIIHAAVATVEGATSTSIGEEPNRRVVISSATPRKPRESSGARASFAAAGTPGGERRASGGRGGRPESPLRRGNPPTTGRTPVSVDAALELPENPKPPRENTAPAKRAAAPIEAADKPLYGKIEL